MKIANKIKNLSQHKKNIISNSMWLLLEKGYKLGLGFFVVSYVARYLGPHDFGMLSYALAIISLTIPVANLGLRNIIKKEMILKDSPLYLILGSSFCIRAISSFIIFIILLFFSFTHGEPNQPTLIIIMAISLLVNPFDQLEDYFASKLNSKKSVRASLIALTVSSSFKLTFILLEMSVVYFAIAQLTEVLTYSAFLIFFYSKEGGSLFNWKPSKEIILDSLSKSWPLMFSGLAILIYMRIDQYMLNNMIDASAVGIYSIAVKLSEIWYFIPTIIMTSFFPNIISNRTSNPIKYKIQTKQLMMLMSALSLLISIPLYFLAPLIVPLIFGDQYLASVPVLQIHIWSSLFVFWGVSQSAWDISENLTRLSLMRTSIGAVSNIILNFFLIPKFGVKGAAYATVISQSLSAFILNLLHKNTRPIFMTQIKSLFFWNAISLQRKELNDK